MRILHVSLILLLSMLSSCKDSRPRATAILQIHPQMESEFDQVLSDAILETVSEKTGEGVDSLRDAMSVSKLDDEFRFKITARHQSRAQAVLIANTTAEAYIDLRRQKAIGRTVKALETLDEELEKQSDLVQRRRKALIVLIQQYSSATSLDVSDSIFLEKAKQKLEELKHSRDVIQNQIKTIAETPEDELIKTISELDIPDNSVRAFYAKALHAENERQSLEAQGLASQHPSVRAKVVEASQALEKAHEEVDILKDVLATKLKLINRQISRLSQMISSQESGQKIDGPSLSYSQAQAEYENARDLLTEMKKKREEEATAKLELPIKATTLLKRAE